MRLGLSSKSADGDSDAEYMSRLIDAQSPTDIYVRRTSNEDHHERFKKIYSTNTMINGKYVFSPARRRDYCRNLREPYLAVYMHVCINNRNDKQYERLV